MFTELNVTFEVSLAILFPSCFVMPLNYMGDMNRNISQNWIAILAVSQ